HRRGSHAARTALADQLRTAFRGDRSSPVLRGGGAERAHRQRSARGRSGALRAPLLRQLTSLPLLPPPPRRGFVVRVGGPRVVTRRWSCGLAGEVPSVAAGALVGALLSAVATPGVGERDAGVEPVAVPALAGQAGLHAAAFLTVWARRS